MALWLRGFMAAAPHKPAAVTYLAALESFQRDTAMACINLVVQVSYSEGARAELATRLAS